MPCYNQSSTHYFDYSMNFKKYFLLYTLIPLALLSIASSYYRFMVAEDYLVEYEGDCDPLKNSCFIGCEDESCTFPYYYNIVTKNASALVAQCGPDITNCESAQICLSIDEKDCSISYCDPTDSDTECDEIEASSSFEIEEMDQTSNSPESEQVSISNI